MEFLMVLIATTAAVFVLRTPLKRWPVAFYALAIAIVVVFLAGASGVLGLWWKPFITLVQRCMVALSLFTVVMFIGVLPKTARAAQWLRPIRAEISIIAWILCMGHMCIYAMPYASRALAGSLGANMMASFAVALVLFVLLLVLGVTSFNSVKHRMSTRTWKNVQRLAYPFFLLVYVHLLFILAPAAAGGGLQAQLSIGIYSVLFLSYAALRLYRASRDRAAAGAAALAEDSLPEDPLPA